MTDSAGAVVPNATVTATNVSTGVSTSRTTTSAGFYSITTLIPGKYTITVTVAGFETFKQENFIIDNEHVSGLNAILRVGAQSETVTVTDEPPELETTNSNLGGTIRNEVYTELPIILQGAGASSQQRDITVFSNLLPGAQMPPGGRVSQFNGLPQRTAEIYVDGLPLTIASAQADNRVVYNVMPIESIDQVQVMTSGFTAETQGLGFEGFSTKSGGNQYHGAVFGIFRNSFFDAWTFASKCGVPGQTPTAGCGNTVATIQNGVLVTVAGPKPGEHQTEYGFVASGPLIIPHVVNGREKLFLEGSYDRFRSRIGTNPTAYTIPTTLMQQGNFQELLTPANGGIGLASAPNYKIYDPATQASCTAHNGGSVPCRYQYGYGPGTATTLNTTNPGNPVLVSAANVNVIPAGELSPQMQYLQKYLPTPTNNTTGAITNNLLGGTPTGYDNWLWNVRADYVVSDKNRIFALFAEGDRLSVPYNASSVLQLPYLNTYNAEVKGRFAEVQDTYTITPRLSNQLRYGYLYFGGPPISNPTMGVTQYEPSAAGINGLPAGQASLDFPYITFAGSNAPGSWGSNGSAANPTYTSVSETYEVVDNVLWTKGRNAMSIGFEFQWLETNADSFDTASQQLALPMSTNETAQLGSTAGSYASNTGYSYASFMLGAMGSPTVTQQPFAIYGMRFRPYAPYFQDDFKATSKLTLNLGMRWDFMPTYQEVLSRWSFLNPTATNPITGNSGALEFAGNWGNTAGVSCNCTTPLTNWYKNFSPRVGFAYALNNKTVIRGAYSVMYTHAGGVGGGSSNNGTGNNGFTTVSGWADSTAGASFYLNSNTAFPTSGGGNVAGPNANFGGAGFSFPVTSSININAASASALTGNYVCNGQTTSPCYGRSGIYASASTASYADPYYGGRAPEVHFFNLGVQRELTPAMTIMLNYVGTVGHFLPGNNNLRGQYSNQINPTYLSTIGVANLALPATAANVATVNALCSNCLPSIPYLTAANGYEAAAALNSTASIGHLLTWMPQYSGVNDTYGVMGANAEYHALQVSLNQRFSKGLSFTVNYTYSKTLDDVGTIRSGWPIPASAFASYAPQNAYKADRIDRSRSTTDLPQLLTVFGVYKLPFGNGGIGANNRAVRWVAGGWELSGISTYSSGLPLAIVGSAASTPQNFGQGQIMPDINPNFHRSPRMNGGWGKGSTSSNLGSRSYILGYISSTTAGLGTSSDSGAASTVTCASSVGPFCNTQNSTIGDADRVAPFGLRAQSNFRLNMTVSRIFDITDRFKFVFRVDCSNVTNHVTFGNNFQNNQIGVNVNNATFGQVTGASGDSRSFQFQGRIKF
ncbi:MAG: carboxypeptidase regulatory-like domain-containing protein [Terracidiphilus sp.]